MSDSKTAAAEFLQKEEGSLDERDYKALETVLSQTARGRAFLDEYSRRHGVAGAAAEAPLPAGSDTDRILSAIQDLHTAINEQQEQPSVAHVRMDIIEMARAIAKTRSEIAAMRTEGNYDQLTAASEEMDAIVQSTEKATTDILQAAEHIQEVAWQLRENGVEDATCDDIDNAATEIYMACSFQDLTGQRTNKVVRVLQYLEARINSMIDIWGLAIHEDLLHSTADDHQVAGPAEGDMRPDAHLLNGPQLERHALGQENIDELLGGFDPLEAAGEPEDMPVVAEDAVASPAEDMAPIAADIAEPSATEPAPQPEPEPVAETAAAASEADLDELLAGFDAAEAEQPAAEGEDEIELGDPDDIIDEEKLKALFA